MIVVSNTSPIINLAVIGQLELLHKLYGRVLIPQAVYDEVVSGLDQPGSREVQDVAWIECRSVEDDTLVAALKGKIDAGEAEAIALAIEEKADLLLLDERHGRSVALSLGIRFVGLLGVIIDAKNRNEIQAVKPVMDALIVKAGFWISQSLYETVLQVSGEQ